MRSSPTGKTGQGEPAVTESRTLERLRGHLATLKDVEERYVRERSGYHPSAGDIEHIEQAALELVVLFIERISTAQYAKMTQAA